MDELYHHGIKGMKWGIRRTPEQLGHISRKTVKTAKKDAKRYADAKMYYGKGAGTRRKLLKAELNKKKKDIPNYEEAFDYYVNNVDYASSAKKAKVERRTRDALYRGKVTANKAIKALGFTSSVALGIYYAQNKDRVDAQVARAVAAIGGRLGR